MTPPRIGSVPYLNAAPLVHGLEPAPVRLVPARLAAELNAGRLDAALVPLAEYLLHAERYVLVDGAAVAARGPVHSVILIPRPGLGLDDLRTVALDPDSRTSVLLTRVLLEIAHPRPVAYVADNAPADARLLIGDPAMAFRRAHPDHPILDLGQLWHAWTGLPFVFAAWVVRREAATPALAAHLRAAQAAGLAARPEIAADAEELRYLTESIRYDLGDDEKAGILRFAGYLQDLGLLAAVPQIDWI